MPRTTAAKAEATNATVPFEFEGQSYTVVPTSEWDIEVLESMEEGKITAVLRAILQDDGYSIFRATKPNIAKIGEFFESLQSALGTEGN